MQDNKSRYLHNQAARRANEVRQRRATVENPQWAMSRPAEWYQNRENLASVKDTLVNQKANQDFWTTDQDEKRNMYQMVINNMVGGSGARMLDLRGLPQSVQDDPNKYRRGRTLFQDPAKSQGFFGDLKSLVTGKNEAAVRAKTWNPLHEEGYGRDWFIDEFGKPVGETLDGIMKLVLPGPLKFMGKKEKVPLPSDRSWIPEGLGEYEKAPMIDLEAMDRDINDGVGIAGVVDSSPEERAEYAAQTFGTEGPGKSTVLPNRHTGEIYYDRGEGLDFEKDPDQPYVTPDDYVEEDFGAFYTDADTLAPERGLPFDDTNREQGIADQYATNFIGPRDDPSRRPGMYDVAGPRLIDRGLIPYPSYLNEEVTEVPPPFYGGRGEMPGMDSPYYYNNMIEGIERGEREKELQDALAADQGRSLMTIPSDFDPNRKRFTDTEDYYDWIRQMQKYGYR